MIKIDYNYRPVFPDQDTALFAAEIDMEALKEIIARNWRVLPGQVQILAESVRSGESQRDTHSLLDDSGNAAPLEGVPLEQLKWVKTYWHLRGSALLNSSHQGIPQYFDSLSIGGFPGIRIEIGREQEEAKGALPQTMLMQALKDAILLPPLDWKRLSQVRNYLVSMLEIEIPAVHIHMVPDWLENSFRIKIPSLKASWLYQRLLSHRIFSHPPKDEDESLGFSLPPEADEAFCDQLLAIMVPLIKNLIPADLHPEDPPLPHVLMGTSCDNCSCDHGNKGCDGCSGCKSKKME